MLEIHGARRRIGERETLAGVDLDVARGEIVALLGPNGAGKTTLLRAIAGRVPLDAGTIRIAGDAPGAPAARRRVGLVPQAVALYTQLGVQSNLEIFGRLAGVSGEPLDRAVAAALDWTGLAPRAKDAVRTLSGGMQRRVNIAAGTLHSPELLLLDEPAVGLDPGARGEVHELLQRLHGSDMAMLHTTHDLHEAEALADRVAIMKDGRVVRAGTVRELVSDIFGEKKELAIRLRSDPDIEARAALTEAGLVPTTHARNWGGAVTDDLHELARLRSTLQSRGVPLESVEVREAGLHGVFLRLTGRELES